VTISNFRKPNSHERRTPPMNKDSIVIFTAKAARKLLKEGFTIVDVKPDKNDIDGKRSVFVFKYDERLMEKLMEN